MSDRKLELAEAFVLAHPHEAAHLTEQMDAETAAGLLHRMHAETASRLLQSMLPQYAARVVTRLDGKLASELLQRMDAALIVVLLRHIGRNFRKRLLESLPARTQASSKLLLNYGSDNVGAWMDAQAFALPEDCQVQEALSRLAAEAASGSLSEVFVQDRNLRLRGVVRIASLISAPPENPLVSLIEPAPTGLPGRATLLSVADHPAWESTDLVPVLNRQQQFVGVLSHARLRQGLRETAGSLPEPPAADAVSGIAEVYGSTLFALFESVGQASGISDVLRTPRGRS